MSVNNRRTGPSLIGLCFATSLFVSVITGSSAAPPHQPKLQAGTLCAREENVVFSCTARKPAKIVSLCTSRDLTKDHGYIQYRFGLPGNVELEFPKQREGSQQAFHYSHYFRAQVDLTEIEFSSDGYGYSVFDDYNGEEKPAMARQGVTVTPPNNGREVTLACRGRAKVDFGNLGDVLPQDPQ